MKLQEIMKKIEKANSHLIELFGKDKLGLRGNYIGIVATFPELKRAIHREYVPTAEKAILEADFDCFNGVFSTSYSPDGKNYFSISFYIVEV